MSAGASVVVLAGLAGLLLPAPGPAELRRLSGSHPRAPTGLPVPSVPRTVPRTLAVLAAVAVLASHGAVATLAAVLALATWLPAARRQRMLARQQARLGRDVPRAAELLGCCLDAGLAPAAALAVVGDAVGGPVGSRLRQVAAVLSAGAEPASPVLGGAAGPVDRLVAALARAAATGAPLAAAARGIASDERDRSRGVAAERARVAGVRAVGPLAVCYLPAFVLVGVVPVVAGVAGLWLDRRP